MPTDKPFVRFELKSLRLLVKFLYTLWKKYYVYSKKLNIQLKVGFVSDISDINCEVHCCWLFAIFYYIHKHLATLTHSEVGA